MIGRRTLLAAAVVLLFAGHPSLAFSAAGKQPPRRDPAELWKQYPLGKPQPKPTSSKSDLPGGAPGPVLLPPRSSAPSEPSPSASFPVAAATGGAVGAAVLALLTVVVLRRRGRGPGGSPAVIVEPWIKPSGDRFSIVKIWPRDIDASSSNRVQRAIEGPARDKRPLSGQDREQFLAAVASSRVRWNTLGRQVSPPSQALPPRRDSVSDQSHEREVAQEPQGVVVAPAAQANDEASTSAVDASTTVRSRVDIGERINEIIRTAEEAAEQVRADAESEAAQLRARAGAEVEAHKDQAQEAAKRLREEAEAYAAETHQAVDSYATQKRREAESEAGRLQAEAASQARAVRMAAEEMAKQLEADARRKERELHESTRTIEAHLEKLLRGVRDAGSQLEALLGGKNRSAESLTGALSIDRERLPVVDRET